MDPEAKNNLIAWRQWLIDLYWDSIPLDHKAVLPSTTIQKILSGTFLGSYNEIVSHFKSRHDDRYYSIFNLSKLVLNLDKYEAALIDPTTDKSEFLFLCDEAELRTQLLDATDWYLGYIDSTNVTAQFICSGVSFSQAILLTNTVTS